MVALLFGHVRWFGSAICHRLFSWYFNIHVSWVFFCLEKIRQTKGLTKFFVISLFPIFEAFTDFQNLLPHNGSPQDPKKICWWFGGFSCLMGACYWISTSIPRGHARHVHLSGMCYDGVFTLSSFIRKCEANWAHISQSENICAKTVAMPINIVFCRIHCLYFICVQHCWFWLSRNQEPMSKSFSGGRLHHMEISGWKSTPNRYLQYVYFELYIGIKNIK